MTTTYYTDNQFNRLPKWARDLINNIRSQRDSAVRALNEMLDSETESPISYTTFVHTGEKDGYARMQTAPQFKKKYIHAKRVDFNHLGLELHVSIRDDHIEVSYERTNSATGVVTFVPTGFQQFEIRPGCPEA